MRAAGDGRFKLSEVACAGPCNNRWRQAQAEHQAALAAYNPLDATQSRPEPPGIRPWPGDPVWCARCTARIRVQLAELDDAACILRARADGYGEQPLDQRVSGSSDDPSPSPTGDTLDELASVLAGWEQAYRDYRGWSSGPQRGWLHDRITGSAQWLLARLDAVLAAPFAADFGTEIGEWHRELTGKGKAGRRRLRKPLRCPSCGLLSLTWLEGAPDVECGNPCCHRVIALADYENDVRQRAGDTFAA